MAVSERTFFGENFFLEGVGVERGGGRGRVGTNRSADR